MHRKGQRGLGSAARGHVALVKLQGKVQKGVRDLMKDLLGESDTILCHWRVEVWKPVRRGMLQIVKEGI